MPVYMNTVLGRGLDTVRYLPGLASHWPMARQPAQITPSTQPPAAGNGLGGTTAQWRGYSRQGFAALLSRQCLRNGCCKPLGENYFRTSQGLSDSKPIR